MAHAWLIGEKSGYRLCAKILGLREATYLDAFERRNLLSELRWSVPRAKSEATRILNQEDDLPLVLCGAKVARAFGLPTDPFQVRTLSYGLHTGMRKRTVVVIPHPSGLSRAWNEPDAIERARFCVKEAVPALADLLGESDV